MSRGGSQSPGLWVLLEGLLTLPQSYLLMLSFLLRVFIQLFPLGTFTGPEVPQALGSMPGPPLTLTACLLGHGHEVVVANVPQVLRGLGQHQRIGCDGGCVGTQEPSTCFCPQECVSI